MNWFRGSIPEAIAAAKRVHGVFAVFVYDGSDSSVSTREKLNDEEISKVLNSSEFVAVEIENGSNDAIQFAQIYPLIVVPSLFFINPQNGIPMEIVGGSCDCSTLLEKLKKLLAAKDEGSRNDTTIKEVKAVENSSRPTSTSETSQGFAPVVTIRTNVPDEENTSPATSGLTEEVTSTSSSILQSEECPPNLDERVQRAKELLAQKQDMKTLEEIEEEKRKEIERRRQSQELLKAKQKKEEIERVDLNKQRKKEREEDRLARERVKAQIAADRAERLARNALLRGESPALFQEPPSAAPSEAPTAVPQNQNKSSVARIKFRFPDNTSQSAQFQPDATLGDVKTYLIQNCSLPSKNIKMVATLPPRCFSDDHMSQTLLELGLTPSAIIIVKPVAISTPVTLVPSGDGVMAFFWVLIAPVTFLLSYLRGIFGFGRETQEASVDSSDEEGTQEPKRPRTEGSYTTRNRPKTAYGRRGEGEAFLRRDGNIHRLNRRGESDNDDENNTWNGNSTQQM